MADTQTVENNAQGQNQENKTISIIIKRQENDKSQPYEEKFEIPYRPNMNVIA
ncbi:succinate dehydrogenase iron-sulfur subunit, partial [Staphylococcus aureus]|nr:succinate dehydrogenase iron-sulfur subunit [Staphylococcus aureus]